MVASVLLPQNLFFLLTCHLCGALYGVVVAYPLSKQCDIPIHVKMVVVVGASMECQWSMDGILHMRAKCWRRPWCALSMPTRFGLVACMVFLKIPWISYGNWDVDPSKVAAVGMLVRGLNVFNS
ncbi:hypothetical protein CK203_053885 [Vitis vinifera]|uniref:Uncharacterized protein n=1 Tax=Vitis vinifera TaxID=29760 RepID=A0A438GSH8_VITVI|nr:hypothetical protein CK203_053885 [Vitis vinifera]